MRLHPREHMCHDAEVDLMKRVTAWENEYDKLTDGEYVAIMNSVFSRSIADWAKVKTDLERHRETDKPGGLE